MQVLFSTAPRRGRDDFGACRRPAQKTKMPLAGRTNCIASTHFSVKILLIQ